MKINLKNLKGLVGVISVVLIGSFASCESENYEVPELREETATGESDVMEEGNPSVQGKLVTIKYLGEDVTVELIDNQYFMGGDMIVEPDSKTGFGALGSKSTGRLDRKWPNNTVHYAIASNLPNTARVTNAIKHWESKTNLKFVRRTNQKAYVYFQIGSGCSSQVGRNGGYQVINLANGCSTGNTIHEIGHAIGLFHEQSRADRDKFITVNFGNIQDGKSHNFQSWRQRGFNGKDLTSSLDFGSIMMYSSKAFSKNGQPTITKKNGQGYSTQRNSLSAADVAGIAVLYPPSNPGNNGKDFRYDLGTPSSVVFGGYTRISHQTKGSIGWTNTSGLNSRDRGNKNTPINNINRDFVFSSQARTFQHAVSNGNWEVILTFGDRSYPRDQMRVKAEGVTKLSGIWSDKGKFVTHSFTTNVNDGKLSLEFSDGGGVNPHWTLTRIWIRKK